MWLLIAGVVAFASWTGGVWYYASSSTAAKCNVASLETRIQELERDAAVGKKLAQEAGVIESELDTDETKVAEIVDAFRKKLGREAVCSLQQPDIDGMLGIIR